MEWLTEKTAIILIIALSMIAISYINRNRTYKFFDKKDKKDNK